LKQRNHIERTNEGIAVKGCSDEADKAQGREQCLRSSNQGKNWDGHHLPEEVKKWEKKDHNERVAVRSIVKGGSHVRWWRTK